MLEIPNAWSAALEILQADPGDIGYVYFMLTKLVEDDGQTLTVRFNSARTVSFVARQYRDSILRALAIVGRDAVDMQANLDPGSQPPDYYVRRLSRTEGAAVAS